MVFCLCWTCRLSVQQRMSFTLFTLVMNGGSDEALAPTVRPAEKADSSLAAPLSPNNCRTDHRRRPEKCLKLSRITASEEEQRRRQRDNPLLVLSYPCQKPSPLPPPSHFLEDVPLHELYNPLYCSLPPALVSPSLSLPHSQTHPFGQFIFKHPEHHKM